MGRVGVLCSILIVMLVSACDFVATPAAPTPTPVPLPTTAEPRAPVTPTPAPPPTARPTRPTGSLDLGVVPFDTYGIRGTALDAQRGLLYVLAEDGDASAGQGVLTVVELTKQQVLASVPLPLSFIEAPGASLSADGRRLYIVDPDAGIMLVVDTGVAQGKLGSILGSVSDVTALALDPVADRLYVVGTSGLCRLHAQTLDQEAKVALPEAAPGVSFRRLVINRQAGLLYITGPGAEIITAYHLADLSPSAAVAPGGRINTLLTAPESKALLLVEHNTILGTARRVVVLQGSQLSGQSWEPELGWEIGQIALDDAGHLLLLEDSMGSTPAQSRMRMVSLDAGDTVQTATTPYFHWAYSGYPRAALALGDTLYSWREGEVLLAVDWQGQVTPLHLGIRLVSATYDEESSLFFALDSAGAIHAVDTSSLQEIARSPVLDPGWSPITDGSLTAGNGRLYVADEARDVTLVIDAASGQRIAVIPKAGQITVDTQRKRLFLAKQGVYVVDGFSYQLTGAIQETVRQDPMLVVPGAIGAQYDEQHDWLFVTMSNNSPGSSAASWLQLYDAATLTRVNLPIKAQGRFVKGLAVSKQPDRVWVAGLFPAADLAVFTPQGQMLAHLRGLGGPLFWTPAQQQLYVADWSGLVTVDAATADIIGYAAVDLSQAQFCVFDATRTRLYASLPGNANLLAIAPQEVVAPKAEPVDALPLQPVQGLTISADGTVLAVSGGQQGYIIGVRRLDGKGWWQVAGALPGRAWPIVKAAPDSPGIFFAYSVDSWQPYGLFRSTDNGQTWKSAMRGLTDLRIKDLAVSPSFAQDGTALLVAGDSGLFQTRDGGETWTQLWSIPGYRVGAAVTASGALRLWMLGEDQENPGRVAVYAATTPMENIERIGCIDVPPAARVTQFALSPNVSGDGTMLAGYPLFLSRDSGRTWQPVGPEPTGAVLGCSVLFSPSFASDQTAYALVVESLYGGRQATTLLRSTDGGQHWEQASEPLQPENASPPLILTLAMASDGQLWAGDAQGMVAVLNPAPLTWQPVPTPTPVPPTPLPPKPVPTPGG